MKRKSFLLAFALFLIYALLTNYWQKTDFGIKADQGLWSANAIKAQYFLYEYPNTRYNCIIGSSLSFELMPNELPPHYFNLAFRGQSVADGLHILQYKNNLPDTLFIESNFITKEFNKDFIDKIAKNDFETT